MTSQTPDMQIVLERLDKLERQNRRIKHAGLLVTTAVGALVLMAQAPPKKTAETVRARAFVLEGPDGEAWGRWFTIPEGPILMLSERNGRGNSTFSAGGIKLERLPQKHGFVPMTTAAHLPSIEVTDSEGFMTTIGVNGLIEPGTGETSTTSAASVTLADKDGKVIWRAP